MRKPPVCLLLISVVLLNASPMDDFAKQLKQASSQKDFDVLLAKINLKEVLADEDVQKSLNQLMNPNYVKVLVSTDLKPLIDKKEMYELIKAGDGTTTTMFTALFASLDPMKAIEKINWQSMLVNGGLKDGIVYVPGLPKGLSIDCGVEVMKVFGALLQGNMSMSNLGSLGTILQSPAGKMIDSWAKLPPRILAGNLKWRGAYDECVAVPDAKYCTVGMAVFQTQLGSYGTCMPQECTENDIASIYSTIITKQLGGLVQFTDDSKYVWCANQEVTYTTGFIVTLVLCCIIGVFVILGTLVELTENNYQKKSSVAYTGELNKQNPSNEGDIEMSNMKGDETTRKVSEKRQVPGFMRFLLCFSFVKNTRAIFSTHVPKGAIQCINGIRVISMWWVILGHLILFVFGDLDNPVLAASNISVRWSSQVILNAYSSVDTFFLLSGLLVSYLALKRMDKTNGKLNYPMYVLHRFIRLTPPYMFALLFYNNIFYYLITGPSAPQTLENGDGGVCNKYWWTNLLYINNLHPAFDKQCFGWTWYLANDMQFYLLAPGIIYLFYIWERRYANSDKRYYGALIVTAVGCLISILIRIILFSVNDYPALISKFAIPGHPYPQKDRQDQLYVKPWTRIIPYLVGLFLGYVFSRKIRITSKKTLCYTIGWIAAIGLGYAAIYGPYEAAYKEPGTFFTKTENVTYGSFYSIAWSVAVAWVVYACETDNAGLIKNFLSWRFWVPLSRLSFGAYLLHPLVLIYFSKSHENGYHYQNNLFAFDFVSNVFFSYATSFILAIAVEVPVQNLEKLVF